MQGSKQRDAGCTTGAFPYMAFEFDALNDSW